MADVGNLKLAQAFPPLPREYLDAAHDENVTRADEARRAGNRHAEATFEGFAGNNDMDRGRFCEAATHFKRAADVIPIRERIDEIERDEYLDGWADAMARCTGV
jgi:hypothetical protein